jgi:hypothetical protein
MEQLQHYFRLAQELNFDFIKLYEQEPLMTQIFGGTLLFVLLIIFMLINNSIKKSAAQKALQKLSDDENIESFDDYQRYLLKIKKVLKSAKADFVEALKENKERYYKEQLALAKNLPIIERLEKLETMAKLYKELAASTRDGELREFYEQKALELEQEERIVEVKEFIATYEFSPENIEILEDIVAYAQKQEDPQEILSVIKERLEGVDFGSNLEIFTFVRELKEEKLGEIYEYCQEQQAALFEDGKRVVAAEVLEYLRDNGEKERMLSYIKTLTIPTHLQELYYRYFNQGDEAVDFAFIANPLEITQQYAKYVEHKITAAWRESERLEELLQKENIHNVIGDDRVRNVIERIDALRKNVDEEALLKEALAIANEAKIAALEAKEMVAKLTTAKDEDSRGAEGLEA